MDVPLILDEWHGYATSRKLVPRDYSLEAIIESSRLKIVTLTGVRRSGKSSLLMLILDELQSKGEIAHYVNAEDSRLRGEADLLDQVLKHFGDRGFLLIDEITAAKDWDGWLARMHDQAKDRLHLIVTSSQSAIRSPNRPLRGRSVYYEVLPLSFVERLRFTNIDVERTTAGQGKMERALNQHLRFGGLPEVVLQSEDMERVRILSGYTTEILGLDVAAATGTSPGLVDVFGKYLLQSPYFSATACLNFLKSVGHHVGKDKILEMERAAGNSMLYHFLEINSKSVKKRTQYPRKAYAGDLGLYYAVLGTEDKGRSMENLVFLELLGRLTPGERIFYWKSRTGAEVDFVVKRGQTTEAAIQVCFDISDEKTLKRELSALSQCDKESTAKECMLINMERKGRIEQEGTRVTMVPLLEWLLLPRREW